MATTIKKSESPSSNVPLLSDKKILQYPTGLGSTALDAFGKEEHYMIFRINTDEKTSKLKDDGSTGTVVSATRVGTGMSARGDISNKKDDSDIRIKFGDAVADKKNYWVTQKGMQRLDRVIVLPMPKEHQVSTDVQYNSNYASTLITKLGDMANLQPGDLASGAWSEYKNWLLAGGGFSALVPDKVTNKQANLNEERLATNPKKEVMFDDFLFRTFTFSYQFAPKSEKESDMVNDIIETFRYYSLPEIAPGKFHYIFPSEFEITFMQGTKENPHIPRIATSALSNITVNYLPNGVWSTLPNGAPLALNITLHFLELEKIDRSRVWKKDAPETSGY